MENGTRSERGDTSGAAVQKILLPNQVNFSEVVDNVITTQYH